MGRRSAILYLSALVWGDRADAVVAPRDVRVVVVTFNAGEGAAWLAHLESTGNMTSSFIPGLSPSFPKIHCTAQNVCLVTTGMAQVNAATSISALVFSPLLNLTKTYWVLAGIAGIDPSRGTIGSAGWARFAISFGLQMELDGREIPANWTSGYFAIDSHGPDDPLPRLGRYGTELLELNGDLLAAALALSRGVSLAHGGAPAAAYRALYSDAAARGLPSVIECDSSTSDTWIGGTLLGERARDWARLVSEGRATYCTIAQEDVAVIEALKRGTAAGRTDVNRAALLRAASDFDRPPPGVSSAANLVGYGSQGGLGVALENIVLAGAPLVDAIAGDWGSWKRGVPQEL